MPREKTVQETVERWPASENNAGFRQDFSVQPESAVPVSCTKHVKKYRRIPRRKLLPFLPPTQYSNFSLPCDSKSESDLLQALPQNEAAALPTSRKPPPEYLSLSIFHPARIYRIFPGL